MASIAYVSDEKMLEYHRINGSREIVFWRLSTKRFSSFQYGDLLFFLSNTASRKEKGIVGYGCFTGEKQMSIDSLWKKHSTATGYRNKDELKAAIAKTMKSEELPEKISCLFLNKVTFFLGAIYPSELGFQIPNNLESFTYLDSHEGHVTLELLQKVKEIGIDYWNASLSGNYENEDDFNREILKYQIAAIFESNEITNIQPSNKFEKHCFSMYRDLDPSWINRDQIAFITFGEENNLYYVYNSTQRNSRENYIKLIGQLIIIKNLLEHTVNEKINIIVLSSVEFTDTQKENLYDHQIRYLQAEI